MNYRIEARQQNFVISDVEFSGAWAFLKLPMDKLPTAEDIASGEWYLFLPESEEYVDVKQTKAPAIALDKLVNPFSKWTCR